MLTHDNEIPEHGCTTAYLCEPAGLHVGELKTKELGVQKIMNEIVKALQNQEHILWNGNNGNLQGKEMNNALTYLLNFLRLILLFGILNLLLQL